MSSKYRDQYGAKSIGLRAALYQGQVLVLGGKRQHYSAVGDEVGRDIFRFPECELFTKHKRIHPVYCRFSPMMRRLTFGQRGLP